MYSLEKRNSNYDYAKRQILSVQENYKVFLPIFAVLAAGLLALNITNALYNYMAVYACVIVNVVGIAIDYGLIVSLIKGNRRQRNLFAQLEEKASEHGEVGKEYKYESDTNGIIKEAKAVLVYEAENEYVVVPKLPEYKHRLFTRYDFRGDFGRLKLPKEEYEAVKEEDGLKFVSDDCEFKFKTVKK